MEVYDEEGRPMGLQFAKKLQLDAEKFDCLKGECSSVMNDLKYETVLEKAKQSNGKAGKMMEVQKEFNDKYESVLARFWKSHQAVLMIDEYCLKINKSMYYAYIQNSETKVDYDEKFYNLGKFKIVNLSVEDGEKCPYRLIVTVNRKCILRKWFGLF